MNQAIRYTGCMIILHDITCIKTSKTSKDFKRLLSSKQYIIITINNVHITTMMTRGKKPEGLIHPKFPLYSYMYQSRPTSAGVSKT